MQFNIPDLREWIAESEQRPLMRALGIRGKGLGEGWSEHTVTSTPASTDGRGSVSPFAATVAADIGAVVAASTTVQAGLEEGNGTAELSLTQVEPPRGDLLVRCEVASRTPYIRVVLITVHDERGVTTAYGRCTFAVRRLQAAPA